jgi:hypothetical protein
VKISSKTTGRTKSLLHIIEDHPQDASPPRVDKCTAMCTRVTRARSRPAARTQSGNPRPHPLAIPFPDLCIAFPTVNAIVCHFVKNKWEKYALLLTVVGMLGSVIGFYISQKTTQKTEMIRLTKDLKNEFNDPDQIFKKIRMSIERCEKLYNHWEGKYDNDEINRYLNFFDALGYYEKQGILDYELIDHMFGAYIIEAYEYNELRRYIEGTQRKGRQKEAASDFQSLAKKIESLPERNELIELARRGCTEKS